MPIYAEDGGDFPPVRNAWLRIGGLWKQLIGGWADQGSGMEPFYAADIDGPDPTTDVFAWWVNNDTRSDAGTLRTTVEGRYTIASDAEGAVVSYSDAGPQGPWTTLQTIIRPTNLPDGPVTFILRDNRPADFASGNPYQRTSPARYYRIVAYNKTGHTNFPVIVGTTRYNPELTPNLPVRGALENPYRLSTIESAYKYDDTRLPNNDGAFATGFDYKGQIIIRADTKSIVPASQQGYSNGPGYQNYGNVPQDHPSSPFRQGDTKLDFDQVFAMAPRVPGIDLRNAGLGGQTPTARLRFAYTTENVGHYQTFPNRDLIEEFSYSTSPPLAPGETGTYSFLRQSFAEAIKQMVDGTIHGALLAVHDTPSGDLPDNIGQFALVERGLFFYHMG